VRVRDEQVVIRVGQESGHRGRLRRVVEKLRRLHDPFLVAWTHGLEVE
jgi:hypothetical protein